MEYRDIVWSSVLEQLDRAISQANCNTVYRDSTTPRYPYIPFHMGTFVDEMEVLRQMLGGRRIVQGVCYPHGTRPKFIDVGCGVGTKLAVASQFGFDCYGIELDEELAKIAWNMNFQVEMADALKLSYAAYDAIYFFCPIRDPKLEARLERRIIATAKPGALIVGNMKCGDWGKLRDRVWTDKKVELACAGIGGYGQARFEVHRKR